MQKEKRENKSKEQIAAQLKQAEKVKRDKILVKLMFPFLTDMKTVYDAQTALMALSGYINAELTNRIEKLKINDLRLDLSKEEVSEIKDTMIKLMGQLETENAEDMADLLERFSNILPQIGAREFLKGPMSTLKIEDIVND